MPGDVQDPAGTNDLLGRLVGGGADAAAEVEQEGARVAGLVDQDGRADGAGAGGMAQPGQAGSTRQEVTEVSTNDLKVGQRLLQQGLVLDGLAAKVTRKKESPCAVCRRVRA
jgi:hypothetical protein